MQKRGQVACQYLKELNEDVDAQFLDEVRTDQSVRSYHLSALLLTSIAFIYTECVQLDKEESGNVPQVQSCYPHINSAEVSLLLLTLHTYTTHNPG